MARQETVLSVFVASPSDVEEERNRLEEVIRDLNTAWARDLGIRLELIKWETDAYPSFGEDPQAVINEQIPQDFDLFIGIMWYKLGTPTSRASSGTIEEFQRAKGRYDEDPDALQLMIYFKDAPVPVPPAQLDYKQLERVSKFRSSLGEEGGLYWSFKTTDEFERFVRLHLTRHIQRWRPAEVRAGLSASVGVEATSESFSHDEEDEIGLLDLAEQFEDEFSTLKEVIERIADATREIGQKMSARTAEMTEFAAGPESRNRKAARRLLAKAAADMDQYVHRLESELPLFSQHLNSGMNALTRAAAVSIEFTTGDEDLEQVRENVRSIREFREIMRNIESQLTDFQGAVDSVPRMTTVLNRSKGATVRVVQGMIDEVRRGQVLAREAETSFSLILDVDAGAKIEPLVDRELNSQQVKILKALAEFDGKDIPSVAIAHSIRASVTRTRHYLSQLLALEYVKDTLTMDEDPLYAIADRGREYLVDHDLI